MLQNVHVKYFQMAKAAKAQIVREELLHSAIEPAQNSLLGYSYENTKVPEIVDLDVSGMELLYGQETEGKILYKNWAGKSNIDVSVCENFSCEKSVNMILFLCGEDFSVR